MKLRLKRIEPLQAGFVCGLLYLFLSLVILVPIGLLSRLFNPNAFGVIFMVFLPIIYGICGFIGGLIMAAIYNLISKWIGGLEVETEEIKDFTEK